MFGFFKHKPVKLIVASCQVNINKNLSAKTSETLWLINMFNFKLCLCPPHFVARIDLFLSAIP